MPYNLKSISDALTDYSQLGNAYPNANKFMSALKDAAYRSVPTTEQMRDPNFIIDNAGIGGIIKPKGGNWLDTYAGSPEKVASQFGKYVDPDVASAALSGKYSPTSYEYKDTIPKVAVNDWLKQKLAKYIQNEMGTPEDPIRRIAEEWPAKRDVLISQQQSKIPNLQELAAKYEDMGLPPEVIANRMANANRDALNIQDKISDLESYSPLHYKPRYPSDFDIDEVMDKRHSAGYPTEGIAKTGIGKLWEHYADRNISPITVKYMNSVHENRNPWVEKLNAEDKVYIPDNMMGTGFDKLADELRKATRPDTDLPDFLRIDPAKLSRVSVPQAVEHVAKINAWRDAERLKEGRNSATVMHKEYPDQGLSWMQMRMPENQDKEALRAALKFEGDTMGHCVGQYCDEVAGGDSNIYSLRDRRGEPHVTIETKKDYDDNGLERIVQIKGKQNEAPVAKYLPAVQDFVRSKDWSMVHDLPNSGLLRLQQYKNNLGDDIYNQALEKHGPYVTQDELNHYEDLTGNYADGGLVGTPPTAYDPMKVADIVASIDAPHNY